MDLRKYLFVDNHAHSILKRQSDLDAFTIRSAFSESRSRQVIENDVPSSLHYRHMLRELKWPTGFRDEADLIDSRSKIAQAEYIRTLWDDVYIIGMIIDDGFVSDQMMPLVELAAASGRTLYHCRRIENVIEKCISKAKTFDECWEDFTTSLFVENPYAPVALKTIMAYRGGLQLDAVTKDEAAADFVDAKKQFNSGSMRIERRPLYHYLLLQAFELAGCYDIPVQVHTGLGDDDANIVDSDPAQFQSVIKMPTLQHTKFVLLHCYPYVRQAAMLCALYPNVYMDLSLSINLISPAASHMVLEALACAPSTKLLAGTDGHTCPESHWYAVRSWKQALSRALDELMENHFIDLHDGERIAADVLHANAIRLYKLEGLV